MKKQNFFQDEDNNPQPMPSDLINLINIMESEEDKSRLPECACANGEGDCIGC